MGQYYKPIILDEKKVKPKFTAYTHDFGCGLKLMEHSWMKNSFVGFIERQLINNPQPIVWAGDYADDEDLTRVKLNRTQLNNIAADYGCSVDELKEKGLNLYDIANATAITLTLDKPVEDVYNHDFNLSVGKRFKYLVNHDKKEFVDKTKVPIDNDGWQIHPLPLLTCEGNDRGGGDYRINETVEKKCNTNLIGYWSRDNVSVESRKSDFKGYKEIIFDLVEY